MAERRTTPGDVWERDGPHGLVEERFHDRRVQSIPFTEGPGEPERVLRVGDIVWDDLTGKKAKVLRIEITPRGTREGNSIAAYDLIGIWLDNDWVGGGRHPWEISLLRE